VNNMPQQLNSENVAIAPSSIQDCPVTESTSTMLFLRKRVLIFWPYLFIAISVTGLAYLALIATR
jgi:hypothetical protein